MNNTTKHLNIIVAVDMCGGFGKDGKIPWHIPEDFKHFKTTTDNSTCIMGRSTYNDMVDMIKSKKKEKDKPIEQLLPNRQCIVITSKSDLELQGGAIAATSLSQAVDLADPDKEIFVIGGERLYNEAISQAKYVYLNIVKEKEDGFDCDRFFPVHYLYTHYQIIDGKQTDQLYIMKYQRKNGH